MCQLTFTHLKDVNLARFHLFNQAICNTETTHKDGFGFYTADGGLFKTRLTPSLITNLGNFIRRQVLSPVPIISHVRLASAGQKIITDENAHPFELSSLILAHNGTLEFANPDQAKEPKYKDVIDSEQFAIALNESYSKNMNMFQALTETYSMFLGKFAFLIYSKLEGKYFVARGDTATLYGADIVKQTRPKSTGEITKEPFGIILNTERLPLSKAITMTSNLAQIYLGYSIDFEKIVEIDKNSVWEYDSIQGLFIRLGELKEKAKVYSQSSFFPQERREIIRTTPTTTNGTETDYWKKGKEKETSKTLIDPRLAEIARFQDAWGLELEEIDEIMMLVLGIPLLAAKDQDLQTLIDIIIPKLESVGNLQENRNIPKMWKMICENAGIYPYINIHISHEIQFPYFLEYPGAIRNTLKDIKRGEGDKHIDD